MVLEHDLSLLEERFHEAIVDVTTELDKSLVGGDILIALCHISGDTEEVSLREFSGDVVFEFFGFEDGDSLEGCVGTVADHGRDEGIFWVLESELGKGPREDRGESRVEASPVLVSTVEDAFSNLDQS